MVTDPFALEPVTEVPLTRTPLEIVLFQVSFGQPLTALGLPTVRDQIAERLRREYPYSVQRPVMEILIQPGREPEQRQSTSISLDLTDATRAWTVSVGEDSFSLTTRNYESRDDLLTRSRTLFEVIADVVEPPPIARLGIRYINRLKGTQEIDRLLRELNPSVSAAQLAAKESDSNGRVVHAMQDIAYEWFDRSRRIQARWGQLPENSVHEAMLSIIPEISWVLDVDSISDEQIEFRTEALLMKLSELAEGAYRIFRWAFTPEALESLKEVRNS